MQGKIVKGIAGFYYVHVSGRGVYECKAKGIFRKDNIKPLVGDDVEIEITDAANYKGNIISILPRRNSLIRPAVANIDQALVIFAVSKQGLECIICFNKRDIASKEERAAIRTIYENSGCTVLFASAMKKEGMEEIAAVLKDKTTAVAGPSGVGKSSIINCLQKNKTMETGAISEKIERGKHTTRHSELISISDRTYIMDTPGFSSLSLFDMEKDELKNYYPEFAPYEEKCKFLTCAHIHEPVCGVKDALELGKISQVRYDNYVVFYEELKEKEKRKY